MICNVHLSDKDKRSMWEAYKELEEETGKKYSKCYKCEHWDMCGCKLSGGVRGDVVCPPYTYK